MHGYHSNHVVNVVQQLWLKNTIFHSELKN